MVQFAHAPHNVTPEEALLILDGARFMAERGAFLKMPDIDVVPSKPVEHLNTQIRIGDESYDVSLLRSAINAGLDLYTLDAHRIGELTPKSCALRGVIAAPGCYEEDIHDLNTLFKTAKENASTI